jgi:predicted nicotinamide N-methyase
MERPAENGILSDICFDLPAATANDDGTVSTRLSVSMNGCLKHPSQSTAEHSASAEDSDGDLCPPRRQKATVLKENVMITLITDNETPLSHVGRQLWRGALLLSDFLLSYPDVVAGEKVIVELGTGAGLVGIVCSMVMGPGGTIFLSDRDSSILELTHRNIQLNKHLISDVAKVRVFDWFNAPSATHVESGMFALNAEEIAKLYRADVILCADCVYDEELTDALFANIKRIIRDSPKAKCFLAMEKRFNFELSSLSVQAYGYRRFLSHIGCAGDSGERASSGDTVLQGRLIPLTFPSFFGYRRTEHLELWEISSTTPQSRERA